MYKVLIIGKDSYIGESLKKWLEQYPDNYFVEIVSPLNESWKNADYSHFETVINLAGIAHIKNITEDMRSLFYSVNRDLSFEIAKHSKSFGIKHFIVFSSMNVYGDYCNTVTDRASVKPTSFYGDSKLQGDNEIKRLEDSSFKVSYIRPPFVYGKGCKGNYNTISKIARKTVVFPTYQNKKSMIYIDNLCEFIRLVIDNQQEGVLTPQNRELVSTSDLVREIANVYRKKIWFTGLFNWMIKPGCKVSRNFKKAFSDDCYDLSLSNYWDFSYCVSDFKTSIIETEN